MIWKGKLSEILGKSAQNSHSFLLRPAFYVSVLSLLINCAVTFSKYLWIQEAFPREKRRDKLRLKKIKWNARLKCERTWISLAKMILKHRETSINIKRTKVVTKFQKWKFLLNFYSFGKFWETRSVESESKSESGARKNRDRFSKNYMSFQVFLGFS